MCLCQIIILYIGKPTPFYYIFTISQGEILNDEPYIDSSRSKKLLAGGRGNKMTRSYLPGRRKSRLPGYINKIPERKKRRGLLQSILKEAFIGGWGDYYTLLFLFLLP